jgi:hypothetical protein
VTTLSPTRSRRKRVAGLPWWALAAAIAVLGGVLVAVGVLVLNDDDSGTAAAPICTPTPVPGSSTPPTVVRANVYNATERDGLAGETGAELEERGFRVLDVANDPRGDAVPGTAIVRHGTAGVDQARWLAAQVEGAELVEVRRGGASVDLVLGDGFTALDTEAEAVAAFAASAPLTTC